MYFSSLNIIKAKNQKGNYLQGNRSRGQVRTLNFHEPAKIISTCFQKVIVYFHCHNQRGRGRNLQESKDREPL